MQARAGVVAESYVLIHSQRDTQRKKEKAMQIRDKDTKTGPDLDF